MSAFTSGANPFYPVQDQKARAEIAGRHQNAISRYFPRLS